LNFTITRAVPSSARAGELCAHHGADATRRIADRTVVRKRRRDLMPHLPGITIGDVGGERTDVRRRKRDCQGR
jgi:hypothetical protein